MRNCQNCKKNFSIEADDLGFYEKMKVPPPTFCPECRLIRRLIWRNDRYLSKINCQLCGNSIFSTFSENKEYTLYCATCYRSDKWNPLDYGQDYDFSKPFFQQFSEFLKKVPVRAINTNKTLINSPYTNLASNLKDCYLIFNADNNENCMYGSEIENSRECVDNTMINECEQSYENVNCQKCYKSFFSTNCTESSDIWFSYDLVGCLNCFGCVGLRHKSYYIFNQHYSKEIYEQKIKEIFSGKKAEILNIESKVREIYLRAPRRYMYGRQNINVSGDYIYNCKNVKNSYVVNEAENCKYCMWLITPGVKKDCWDYIEYGENAEKIYETIISGKNSSNIKFSNTISSSTDVEYSYGCRDVYNVFGCIGLQDKKFCIFNKKYSKEEYGRLVEKIKKHMNEMPYIDKNGNIYRYGEFFPFEISPRPYNRTSAQEFFPLTKEEAENLGYRWEEFIEKNYTPTLGKDNIPKIIYDVSPSIINETIGCSEWGSEKSKIQNCTKAFRIIPNELVFYKRHSIPLPNKCPNCRHFDRIEKRNSPKLWHRTCMCNKEGHLHGENKCEVEFETSYATNRPEIVYCEKCYQQEIY